jgi:CxxC motif-containing protein (DUF1111 family)
MNVRHTFGWFIAASIVATATAVSVGFAAHSESEPDSERPNIDPGFVEFTRLRHTEDAAVPTVAPGFPAAIDPEYAAHRMFNARSCAECHRQGGVGGAGPNENNVRLIDRSRIQTDTSLARHFGLGPGVAVVHRKSVSPDYAEWRLGLIERFAPHDPEVAARVLRRMDSQPGCGLPHAGLFCCPPPPRPMFEQRNTPPLFGLGLIESIPQCAIDAVAASQPKELQGRSPRLQGGGRGRFGWKSSTATLATFNENACAVELGLTTPRFTPATFRPSNFRAPSDAPLIPPAHPPVFTSPDMTDADLAALNRYIAKLPAPRQVMDPALQAKVAEGAQTFHAIGCAVCHQPDLGGVTGLYSDLLLHTVGTSGGGFYGRGPMTPDPNKPDAAKPDFDIVMAGEFRTPPLWGVADSGPYLHDGSAKTLEQAIVRHHLQASSSNLAYQSKLTNEQRASLIAFLKTLRAP